MSLHAPSSLTGLFLLAALTSFAGSFQDSPANPRERLSLDDGWRFTRDDPVGNTVSLSYDVRPVVDKTNDTRPADAKPAEARTSGPASIPVTKAWILPTGNRFLKDPAQRHPRPPGNWGGDVPFVQAGFDDSSWQQVDLPHDWAITGPFLVSGDFGGMGRLPSWGIGWYRKKIFVPASDAGKSVFLDVDGAMSYAAVWVNGTLAGGWPYGYTSWRLDLTPFLKFGADNQLAIRLDNPPSSARWYPGGGLYRNVWLVKTQPVHIAQWGTRITASAVSAQTASLALEVAIDNNSPKNTEVAVDACLYALDDAGHPSGDVVAIFPPAKAGVNAQGSSIVALSLVLPQPRLWGPPPQQKPNRYVAITTLSRHGKILDRYETAFGIRSLRFDPAAGFFINGEHIPLRGTCLHHDLGALGAAFNSRAAERQLEMLQEMGCNALRTTHNTPAPELLDLADRMGFLVLDENFDCWALGKTPLDFHLIFDDWCEQDLRSLIRRDRNHPSVILWGVGNEVGEQYTGSEGAAVARKLCAIAHDEDPTRPVTTGMNFAKASMPLPEAMDVIGLNYQGEGIRWSPEFAGTDRIRTQPSYPTFHDKFPGKMILATESASAFSSRGVYFFPVTRETSDIVRDGRGGDSVSHQVSGYELHAVDFGSSADKVFATQEQNPYVAGEFVWTGWDYLGEPTPYYSSRSSYSGIIDLAGFKKDRFYLYQAHWRPDLPMAHLLPHWTWPERVGQITPVHLFTSGDEAELFLNGKSLGRKTRGPHEYRLRWDDVVYEPGTLEVIAYKNGKKWAVDSVKTAGAPAALDASPDRARIRADGRDLSFITVRVVDARGTLAPRADNTIRFSIEGPGEIVATDNGDATSFEPFQAHARKAFNGLCLVIIRGRPNQPGQICVTARSDGLRDATVAIYSGQE